MQRITEFLSIILLVTASMAHAAPVPVDTSALDRSITGDNRFGLGATTSIAERPFVGVDNQTTSLPYIKYRYKDFYIEGTNLGFTLSKSEFTSFELLATPRFYEVKASFADNGELNGIDETKPTYLAGVSAQYHFNSVTLTMQLLADVAESDGYEFILGASQTYKPHADVTIAPGIGITYQDSELVDHFYGVQANEVATGRPLYKADSSANPYLSVTAIWQASKHIQLLGQLKYEQLDSGITDSPIVDEDSIVTSVIGAVYLF